MATDDAESEVLEGEMNDKMKVLEEAMRSSLGVLDDPSRDGLAETPKRWAKMMLELTEPHRFSMTTFPNDKEYDEMVVEVGIPFHSLCEHHLAPFFGTAAVTYVPGHRIVGISKLCRTVEHFARRLQVQERMTQQVAEMLQETLRPKGVAVLIRARHMCQEMRGVRKSGVETVTSCLRGCFLEKPESRQEFMNIARRID